MLESEGLKDLRNRKTVSFDLLKMERVLRKKQLDQGCATVF